MNEPYREVAAAILIGSCGRLLLQQRDDVPGILYPGMIGLFGGHREGDESFLACVQREVQEEIGVLIPREAFEPLARLRISYPSGGGVLGEYFLARDVPAEGLIVTEGSLLLADAAELGGLLPRMTPSATFIAKIYMMRGGG